MQEKRSVRCAIYTRKSTEEGLDQDFNSLDAQREACEAYIVSQRHEGWKLVRRHFDDGGFTGGNMDRPALVDLLEAVDLGKIDVIVVYKVDRLTRSLADFAKIVERLDARGVSFVSVTQQFNTTSSMGRLTLNVLLSFAQFEREVTAERIRDKIAASRKKGIWTGGPTPIGYDVVDKKLVVNASEATTVREIFDLYLQYGTVRALKDQIDERGIETKRRIQKNGKTVAGRPFSRGNLYHLLSNPIYIGRVRYQDQTFEGEQDAIIDQETWDAVQDLLSDNASNRTNGKNTTSASLLTGLIFDETGDRLSPVHTAKNGKRYHYYVSRRLVHHADRYKDGWRIPAPEIECVVIDRVSSFMANPHQMLNLLPALQSSIEMITDMQTHSTSLANQLNSGSRHEVQRLIRKLVQRIAIAQSTLQITFEENGLIDALGLPANVKTTIQTPVMITTPFKLRRRGVEAKLVITDSAQQFCDPDTNLIQLIAQARLWFTELATSKSQTINHIAARENKHASDISRALPLAFLAPDIVKKILEGRQPTGLTAQKMKTIQSLPSEWPAQRVALGFV